MGRIGLSLPIVSLLTLVPFCRSEESPLPILEPSRKEAEFQKFQKAVADGRGREDAVLKTVVPSWKIRSWPGPRLMHADALFKIDAAEDLRDAPATMKAPLAAYSLWPGAQRPVSLNKDGNAFRAVPVTPISLPKSQSLPSEAEVLNPVFVEIDASGSSYNKESILSELSEKGGFRLDDSEAPILTGEGGTSLRLRGWVPSGSSSELLQVPEVLRVETARSRMVDLRVREGSETELLIGVRVPPESSPSAALLAALERFSKNSGLRFGAAHAYQRIPGSEQIAVVISGRLATNRIGSLLADPDVVKILPAPVSVQAPSAKSASRSSSLGGQAPYLVLISMLMGWFFLKRRPLSPRRSSP